MTRPKELKRAHASSSAPGRPVRFGRVCVRVREYGLRRFHVEHPDRRRPAGRGNASAGSLPPPHRSAARRIHPGSGRALLHRLSVCHVLDSGAWRGSTPPDRRGGLPVGAVAGRQDGDGSNAAWMRSAGRGAGDSSTFVDRSADCLGDRRGHDGPDVQHRARGAGCRGRIARGPDLRVRHLRMVDGQPVALAAWRVDAHVVLRAQLAGARTTIHLRWRVIGGRVHHQADKRDSARVRRGVGVAGPARSRRGVPCRRRLRRGSVRRRHPARIRNMAPAVLSALILRLQPVLRHAAPATDRASV